MRGKHTMKPAYFYKQIERMFPGEKYLELFANKRHNEQWEIWGNQLQSPESEDAEQ
jgi:N6-adenosine-specific RNA methylase IME4